MPRGVPGPRLACLMLTLCALFWSGNVLTARALHADVPPFALAFWRWVFAALLVLPFAARELRARAALVRSHWRTLVPAGVLGMGAYSTLVYTGLQTTTATNAALINAAIPVMIAALGAALGRHVLRPRQWAGVALSFAGVAVIVLEGDPAALVRLDVSAGDLWVVAGTAGFVVYTVCFARPVGGLSPRTVLAVTLLVAALASAPFYLWEHARGVRVVLGPGAAAGMAYVAVFPSVFAYLFWARAVASVGPGRAGVFMYLMPVFTIALGIALLGERLALHHAAGIALVAAGIAAATLGRPLRA